MAGPFTADPMSMRSALVKPANCRYIMYEVVERTGMPGQCDRQEIDL